MKSCDSGLNLTPVDATILIVGARDGTLITAVIDKPADLPTIQRRLLDIAVRIGEEA